MIDPRTRARHLSQLDNSIERDSANWRLLQAYLNRSSKIDVVKGIKSGAMFINFETALEAEEFQRFLRNAQRRVE